MASRSEIRRGLAIVNAIRGMRNGGAVEIAGVRIEGCNSRGETETMQALKNAQAALADVRELLYAKAKRSKIEEALNQERSQLLCAELNPDSQVPCEERYRHVGHHRGVDRSGRQGRMEYAVMWGPGVRVALGPAYPGVTVEVLETRQRPEFGSGWPLSASLTVLDDPEEKEA